MGGAGKTTLLRYLGWWWHTTGFVRRIFYFGYDEKAWTLQQIMTSIAQQLYGPRYFTDFQPLSLKAQQAMLAQTLRAEKHLLILDNLESITGAHLAIQHTLPQAEQEALRGFLADLAKGHTLALLGSRSSEDWLARGTFDDNLYELPGLDKQAASTLADRILERNHATRYRKDADLLRLLKLLDGYPLALEVVLANLAHQTPSNVLAALQGGDEKIDVEANGKDEQQDRSIFEQKTESILRCIDYSHSNLSPQAQQLLLCLAPFTSVLWLDQNIFNGYINQLRQQPALASSPFERWPEVIREAQNWGLLSPDRVPDFLRLQPIFPYFLRNRLNAPEQADVKTAIETAFRLHYDAVGNMLYKLLKSKEAQERQVGQLLTSLEYENLVSALNVALAVQTSFYTIYLTLTTFIDAIKDEQRGLELGQAVLNRLNTYPPEKLTGLSGLELSAVIDNIATRQLSLKQFEEAEATFQKALKILLENKQYDANDSNIRLSTALIYHRLGRVAEEQRQWQKAEQHYQRSLQIKIEYNDRYNQADTYHCLGVIAQEQRQCEQAEQYYQQALQIFIEYNDRYNQAGTYHQLGRLAAEQRQWEQARDYFLTALTTFQEYNDTFSGGIVLRSLARLWQASNDASLPAAIAQILGITVEETEASLRKILEEK